MSDPGLVELVNRDLESRASSEESESLRNDEWSARMWKDVLIVLLQQTDSDITTVKAAVDKERQVCLRLGFQGKDRFFRFSARKEAERADLIVRKGKILAALREAKSIIVEESSSEHEDFVVARQSQEERLARIEKKVDRILGLLERS